MARCSRKGNVIYATKDYSTDRRFVYCWWDIVVLNSSDSWEQARLTISTRDEWPKWVKKT